MTETLRERIARAIYEEPGCGDATWDKIPVNRRTKWLEGADRVAAVIAADRRSLGYKSAPLDTIEEFLGDVDEQELSNGDVICANDAWSALYQIRRYLRLRAPFICGQSHEKDARGMAMKIHVAPMPGADWFATYTLDNPASDYPLERPLLSECPDCKSDGAHHPGCPATEDCPVCGYDCAGADSQPVECPKRSYPKEDRL